VSVFECPICRVSAIEPVTGADKIDLAAVMGFNVIVERGRFRAGDLAIFIPPDAMLPRGLADSLKGTTKLFGERKNRTRAYKLRGVVNEGVLVGPLPAGKEGTDAAVTLGIVKYEPRLPKRMRGECVRLPSLTIAFDLENWRRHPGIVLEGELVEISEKIHGTFCGVSVVPNLNNGALYRGDTLIYSKGLGQRGFVIKDSEPNAENLYLKAVKRLGLRERIISAFGYTVQATIFGELYGSGVQDLCYGEAEPQFGLFDVYLGAPKQGRFLNGNELDLLRDSIGPRVPILYRGPFEKPMMREFASGESVIGNGANIREGVVVRSCADRWHPKIGRVILKYVSPEYLARSGGTEYQ